MRVRRPLAPGTHTVRASFRLLIPYLPGGPDAPLELDFETERRVEDVGATPWTLAASAFNWTPEVIRAERPSTDIAVGIVTSGVSPVVELEPGQLWRSFPSTSTAEAAELRERIAAAGGRVSIVGASLDDWLSPTRRRDDDERLAFLLPQLRTAHDLGAEGVRLPIGQAGPALLRRLQPVLHELGPDPLRGAARSADSRYGAGRARDRRHRFSRRLAGAAARRHQHVHAGVAGDVPRGAGAEHPGVAAGAADRRLAGAGDAGGGRGAPPLGRRACLPLTRST